MQKPFIIRNEIQSVKKYTDSRKKKLITAVVSQPQAPRFYEKAATDSRRSRSPRGILAMKHEDEEKKEMFKKFVIKWGM